MKKLTTAQTEMILAAVVRKDLHVEGNGRTINILIHLGLVQGSNTAFKANRNDLRTLTIEGKTEALALLEAKNKTAGKCDRCGRYKELTLETLLCDRCVDEIENGETGEEDALPCEQDGCVNLVETGGYCSDHSWLCSNDADSDLGECDNPVYGEKQSECNHCLKKREAKKILNPCEFCNKPVNHPMARFCSHACGIDAAKAKKAENAVEPVREEGRLSSDPSSPRFRSEPVKEEIRPTPPVYVCTGQNPKSVSGHACHLCYKPAAEPTLNSDPDAESDKPYYGSAPNIPRLNGAIEIHYLPGYTLTRTRPIPPLYDENRASAGDGGF